MPAQRLVSLISLGIFLIVNPADVANGGVGGSHQNKIDPRLRPLLESTQLSKSETAQRFPSMIEPLEVDPWGNEYYGVVIYTDDPVALVHEGVALQSRFGSFATARVTLSALAKLAEHPDVKWIEASKTLYPTLDVSVPETGADKIHSGMVNSTPYKGNGVIIGVIDTGIDWKHLDFRIDTDTTQSRILFLWDQTITKTGSEMTPNDRDASLPSYGVEYSQVDINDEIDGTPTGFVREQDIIGHGSHVGAIAAGDGSSSGSGFIGVAPEADLIIVKAGDATFPSINVIDAINYIDKTATSLGKPAVMNLSLGGHSGAHDGTDAMETVLDLVLGGSGKVAVVAAGNEGGDFIHGSGTVAQGDSAFVEFEVPSYTDSSGTLNDFVLFDMWYEGADALSVTVETPGGDTFTQSAGSSGSVETPSNQGHIIIDNATTSPPNGDNNCIIDVFDNVALNPPVSGTWKITVVGTSVTAGGRFDIWLYDQSENIGTAKFTTNGDNSFVVGMPGTSVEAITVGSYVTKRTWPSIDGMNYQYTPGTAIVDSISEFSSAGPTRDNRQKPELTAPGQGIVSVLSQDESPQPSIMLIVPDGTHYISQGTSQATPHVTGAAALLLQINPSLNAAQVKTALTSTSKSDAMTGAVPNPLWGFGKLDAFAAANNVVTSVQPISSTVPTQFLLRQNYPNPFNPSTTIEFDLSQEEIVKLHIYDVTGQEVARVIDSQRMSPGRYRVQWNAISSTGLPLSSGVYFYRIDAGRNSDQAKMVLVR